MPNPIDKVASSSLPSFILGYHGCDKKVAERILSGNANLEPSENSYDWLGHGIYFWENNPARALEYAKTIQKHSERVKNKINNPAVIGAIIDCGHCLDLLEAESIDIVKKGYTLFGELQEVGGFEAIPENKLIEDGFPMLRHLDCAVMEMIHKIRATNEEKEFDSVRAMFPEGKELYPTSGFRDKNHIQICVRTHSCIKGYFRV